MNEHATNSTESPIPPPSRATWLFTGAAAAFFVVLLVAWAWLKYAGPEDAPTTPDAHGNEGGAAEPTVDERPR